MVASILETDKTSLLSNIYALTYLIGKHHLWTHIHYIRNSTPLYPWIIVGNFNAITNLDEKRGGIQRLDPSYFLLHDNIAALNLVYVKHHNSQFTWIIGDLGRIVLLRD